MVEQHKPNLPTPMQNKGQQIPKGLEATRIPPEAWLLWLFKGMLL